MYERRERCLKKFGITTSFIAEAGKPSIIYIDLHLVHEVTSPQAFEGLAPGRSQSAPSRSDVRDDGPQRADERPLQHYRSDLQAANRHADEKLPGFRHQAVRS